MQIYTSKKDCCGCTACMNVCPKNAITMIADNEGFLYPQIDENKCVDCGACKRVCAFQSGYIENHTQKAYAVKHKDEQTRFTSRSGGVFIAISDYILNKNGVIYGAAFDKDFAVHHIRATTSSERDLMKGSKYVQSNMNDVFLQVKKDLIDGRYVLFSGTTCQVGGLTKYLEKTDTTKLYTCDIICHGVPSPKIWGDYVNYTKDKYGNALTKVSFRDKEMGWRQHRESFVIDGTKHFSNEYAYLFLSGNILRPSCFQCKYSNIDRPSDFTIGDCWGIHKRLPDFNDNKGTSLLFINTEKADAVFEVIKEDVLYREDNISGCVDANPNLHTPTQAPKERAEFWKYYYSKGFKSSLKKYYNIAYRSRLKKKIIAKFKKVF